MDKDIYETKEELYNILTIANITEVEYQFSGSGDSGDIDDITINYDGKIISIYSEEAKNVFTNVSDMQQMLSEYAYAVLEKSGHDWYNNEGGHGTITINVAERKTLLDMNIAYTEYTNYEEEY